MRGGGVLVCKIFNSLNSSVHNLFTNSARLSEWIWFGDQKHGMFTYQYSSHSACFLVANRICTCKSCKSVLYRSHITILSYINTKSIKTFSPTFPTVLGMWGPHLAWILHSLASQVLHRSTNLQIFSHADIAKNVLWNLSNVPATPLCPPAMPSWQILNTSSNFTAGTQTHKASYGLTGSVWRF